MQDLRITTIQSVLEWHNRSKNLERLDSKIDEIEDATDVIILPEMFTTGFSMECKLHAEEMNGHSIQWMRERSDEKDAAIVGSLIIKEGQNYYNRLVWMQPGGEYHSYDKRHLFAMAHEHQYYTAGEERLIVHYKGWRICPMICYDLRFPVWSRNQDAYDLLIYVANWPEKRSYDWRTLLRARAIENQSYVVGVNRVGTDDNGLTYNGDSCVIDPGWHQVLYHKEHVEDVHTITLSASHLNKVRTKLPFLEDRDEFNIV